MRIFVLTIFIIVSRVIFAQEASLSTEYRVNIINPGIEIELPINSKNAILANAGVGYNLSYPKLSKNQHTGINYLFAPFVDVQIRRYYNLISKDNAITHNHSGKYWGIRSLSRANTISSNFIRYHEFDFSIALIWGMQRKILKDKVNFSFNIGPAFYFNGKGSSGFAPLIPELSIGWIL